MLLSWNWADWKNYFLSLLQSSFGGWQSGHESGSIVKTVSALIWRRFFVRPDSNNNTCFPARTERRRRRSRVDPIPKVDLLPGRIFFCSSLYGEPNLPQSIWGEKGLGKGQLLEKWEREFGWLWRTFLSPLLLKIRDESIARRNFSPPRHERSHRSLGETLIHQIRCIPLEKKLCSTWALGKGGKGKMLWVFL